MNLSKHTKTANYLEVGGQLKILIISQYYYPEQFLINEIAEELVKIGHKVTVLTGLPNYPSGKIPRDFKCFRKRRETINGVKIIRVTEIPRGKPNIVRLIINYASFVFFASIKTFFLSDYDIVMSYQVTPITQVIPAIVFSKLKGKKLLVYCLDLFPYSFEHWTKPNSILQKINKWLSKKIYSSAHLILFSSQPFIEYMRKINCIPNEKLRYLPQHAPDSMLNLNLSSAENNVCNFMFAGNIGTGQNIEVIVEAVELIKHERNFIVHLVGDGNNLQNLKNLIKEKEIENYFVFHGRFQMSEMHKMYKLADALLITLRSGQTAMPGKLQTYMTTGKPIFGSIDGAAYKVIKESKCGGVVASADSKGLSLLMLDFINNKEKYKNCGYNAKVYFIENFKKEIFMAKLESTLRSLTEN